MRILIVGAGATGGYFGARLAKAGRDVTFLVRPRRAAALRERGLRLIGPGSGPEEVITPRLALAEQLTIPYDLVIVSVKATALPSALRDVAPAVGPRTALVPFLNGISHLDTLNARFGAGAVLGAVVKVETTLDENGDIVRLSPQAELSLGEQDGRPSPRVQELVRELGGAGFEVAASPDIATAMWHKWVFITTLGALTCLMRGTVGDIAAVPGGVRLGPAILAEAAAVSAASGHPVPAPEQAATEATMTQAGSALTSSTYRDVAVGHPTEVEHVFGDLAARARALGVETPLLDLATMQLRVHQHRVERQPS
ncbi:ketopantoate reductase family protein [Peterkaempfera bronchialis]|uniref:ketopantoate reductase family protein n=1 Tax=Peterkaempfera bronchialis TaxID=2126346 RepID=UPI003C2F2F2F